MIVERTSKVVSVGGFHPGLGLKKNVPIVSAAVAYDDPSGEVIILLIHQALYFPDMENNLLCPMQMRLNDVNVDE